MKSDAQLSIATRGLYEYTPLRFAARGFITDYDDVVDAPAYVVRQTLVATVSAHDVTFAAEVGKCP